MGIFGRMMSTQIQRSAPWLMLAPASDAYRFYSLAEEKVLKFAKAEKDDGSKVVGSSHGWLALLKNRHDLSLWNPLSRRNINLPPLLEEMRSVRKVVISQSPDEEDCRAVLCGVGGVAFCLPGRSAEWTPLGLGDQEAECLPEVRSKRQRGALFPNLAYNEVAYSSRRKVFTCIAEYDVYGFYAEDWDLREPGSPKLDEPEMTGWCGKPGMNHARFFMSLEHSTLMWHERGWPLWPSCRVVRHPIYVGDRFYLLLRLVDLEFETTLAFFLYKLDDGFRMKRATELDGLAVFVGINHSFALPAVDFPPLKPDTIYFADGKIGVFDPHHSILEPASAYPPHYLYRHDTDWFSPTPTPHHHINATCWFTPTY